MRQKEELNTVAFKVRPDANKVEIRTAVESVFNVKVTSVRTAILRGQAEAHGPLRGTAAGLEEGDRDAWRPATRSSSSRGPRDHGNPHGQAHVGRLAATMTYVTNDDITKDTPEKSLLLPKRRTNGRNGAGRITVRHRGGGAKRMLRQVDFRREKLGIPAQVAAIEYDPGRSARHRAAPLSRRREALHHRARTASRSATR